MWTQQQEQAYLRGLPSQHPQQQTLHPGIMDDRTHHHHHHHHRSTTMDLPVPSNPRASRNMAEKQRRDNLNKNISKMAALVPTVAGSSRRMDKISILRLTAAFLRMEHTLGRGLPNFLPPQFNNFNLEDYFGDNMIESGSFWIVVTTTGNIVDVSRKVEQHLGHAWIELVGESLYNFVHPDDHKELTRNLTPDEMQVYSNSAQITEVTCDNNSSSSEDSASLRNERKPFRKQRRSFELRMSQRTVSRREHTQYEPLHIFGILRLADACKHLETNGNRRHREISSTSNDIILVAIARLLKNRPITEISIIDADENKYVTRHLVDGRIIYCDHRVSVVAGYLSEEVSGQNAFSFMHKDDFRWTIIGLRQMYDRAETCGSSCYRLLSKTGQFIYLRTHGYLEFDKDTQTVVSLVCVNTLVPENEGIELIKEMKKRLSPVTCENTKPMIENGNDVASFELQNTESQRVNSQNSLEDPSQLEDAITHLIRDLPSPSVSEERLSPSPMSNAQFTKTDVPTQDLSPTAAQTTKIGAKKIDPHLSLQGKGNRTPKHEAKPENGKRERSSVSPKLPNSKSIEKPYADRQIIARNKVIGQENPVAVTRKSLEIHELIHQNCNIDDSARNETIPSQVNVLAINNPNAEPIKQSAKNGSSAHVSQENNPCEVKIEHTIDILKQLEKQEPVLGYLENAIPDTGVTSSNSESNHQYALKRICSEEDIHGNSNKKKCSDVLYASTDVEDEQKESSYINCRPFVSDEEFPGLSAEYTEYNNGSSQSLKTVDSPKSSLHDVSLNYQQLDPLVPLVISNTEGEQFDDLQTFKDDGLLSPSLDANPDLVMKIFDDLRPVMGFEKTFNETKAQQLAVNNVVSDEIRRTHRQLENSMALRESQINVLARDLNNPALQAQRENLTQLQAEHKIQKQILHTLQQDHHNIQVNVKHNIGV